MPRRRVASLAAPQSALRSAKEQGVLERNVTGQHVLGTAELPQQSRVCRGEEGAGRSDEFVKKCGRKRASWAITDAHSLRRMCKALLRSPRVCGGVWWQSSLKSRGCAPELLRLPGAGKLQVTSCLSALAARRQNSSCQMCVAISVCCWRGGSYGLFTGSHFSAPCAHPYTRSDGRRGGCCLSEQAVLVVGRWALRVFC